VEARMRDMEFEFKSRKDLPIEKFERKTHNIT